MSLSFRNVRISRLFSVRNWTMPQEKTVITIDEVKAIKDDLDVLFIDVREPGEIRDTGLIPGSINIPLNSVKEKLQRFKNGEGFGEEYKNLKPNLETPIVFTCRSGRRAGEALEIAKKLGFNNVKNYKGSWIEWEKYHPK